MSNKSTRQPIWLPLAIALAVVVGVFIGSRFNINKPVAENDRKLNAILNLIAQDYVDTTNFHDLVELSIPEILRKLDPHTSYFSAEELKASTDDLNGSFSGIGIQFMLDNDTIGVVEVIPGGPSEKVGIMPGDRIITIDDSVATGENVTNGMVMKRLRGPKGTKVKLGIKRQSSSKLLTFTVTRGDIPVNTVDAYYMIDKNTGYVKINQFGRHTYDEFITAMASLQEEGAKRYIIDLRGNGGGFMEMAVLMANEFLPENMPIVFTKGRYKRDDSEVWSDGNGSFQDAELAVLIDEYSAVHVAQRREITIRIERSRCAVVVAVERLIDLDPHGILAVHPDNDYEAVINIILKERIVVLKDIYRNVFNCILVNEVSFNVDRSKPVFGGREELPVVVAIVVVSEIGAVESRFKMHVWSQLVFVIEIIVKGFVESFCAPVDAVIKIVLISAVEFTVMEFECISLCKDRSRNLVVGIILVILVHVDLCFACSSLAVCIFEVCSYGCTVAYDFSLEYGAP